MSFNWKGLLGVGGGSGGGTTTNVAGSAGVAGANGGVGGAGGVLGSGFGGFQFVEELEWSRQLIDPFDLPNMLGIENFGNTCYVNSVMQALYFCDPFREALLTYSISAGPSQAMKAEEKTERAEETLFYALRTLFRRMSAASVQIGHISETGNVQSAPSSSSSYIGSGLSRKVSSRPGTANSKAGMGVLPTGPSNTNQTNVVAGAGSKGGWNSCSNIVVPDTDIKAFLGSLKKSNILFDSTAHQDAHELLNFVLNRIGEDIVEDCKDDKHQSTGVQGVGKDGKTLVQRLFEGILTNETRCLTCESITSRDEAFLDLSLDIERNSSVTACLRQFSASEMLCARNKFFCDTCSGLQEAEKRMKIKRLPNVLALHLKRFKYEESVQRFVKLAYRVVFPMQLRLFNTSDDAADPDKLYELYGIIVHMGAGPHHGHYVAIIKVGVRWFVFDDETISVIDEADLVRYYGDTPGSGSAYVLFYQAVDLDMQSLGLPDVKAIRDEKLRARREASIRAAYAHDVQQQQLQQQQQQQQSLTVQSGSTIQRPLSASGSIPIVGSTAPETQDAQPFETPTRSVTPAEGRSIGLFGRRQASNVVVGGAGTTTGGTAGAPSMTPSPSHGGVPAEGGQQSEGKGSWLSSLRGRKPSTNAYLTPPAPSSHTNQLAAPIGVRSTPLMSSSPDDEEARSVSASSSSNHDAATERSSWLDNAARQRSPARDNGTMSHTVNDAAPSSQGATFKPAEHALSKKEQERIAKQAARQSRSSSVSHLAGMHHGDGPHSEQQQQQQQHVASIAPSSSTSTGWRRITSSGAPSTTGAPVLRRPSTAAADTNGAAPGRRRNTLSRAFGIGRK